MLQGQSPQPQTLNVASELHTLKLGLRDAVRANPINQQQRYMALLLRMHWNQRESCLGKNMTARCYSLDAALPCCFSIVLKHLPHVETRVNCPQTLLSLGFQYVDDISE